MTTLPKRRIRWRATGPDGIAHAFRPRVAAICGARNQSENFDYPLRTHCPTCMAREQEVTTERKAG